jgi:hypothetical protein
MNDLISLTNNLNESLMLNLASAAEIEGGEFGLLRTNRAQQMSATNIMARLV